MVNIPMIRDCPACGPHGRHTEPVALPGDDEIKNKNGSKRGKEKGREGIKPLHIPPGE